MYSNRTIHLARLQGLSRLLPAALLILALASASCGGGSSIPGTNQQDLGQPGFELPALPPAPAGPNRSSSAQEVQVRNGSTAFISSHAVGVEGTVATLDGSPDRLVYQIFEFDLFDPAIPVSLEVEAESTTPDDPWWIAFSDYTSGTWRFVKRTEANASFSANVFPDGFGNGTNGYVAVIAYQNIVTLSSLTLTSELNPVDGPWHHTWGTSTAIEGPTSIALDSQGNVFVAGLAGEMEDGHYGHLITLKYAPDGLLLYAYNWYIPDENDTGELAEGMDIYISPSDEVFVAGTMRSDGDTDAMLMKLDNSLAMEWCARWGEAEIERTSTMTASPDGQTIHLVGYTESQHPEGLANPFLLSIAAEDGLLLTSAVFTDDAHSYFDYVAVEPDGELHIAGGRESEALFDEGLMVKLLANGDMAWSRIAPASNITGISYDNSGNSVYSMAEEFSDDYGNPDVEAMVLLKVDGDGNLIDSAGFEHPTADMICAHMYRGASGFELPCNMSLGDSENFGQLWIGDDFSFQGLVQLWNAPFLSFNSKVSGNAIYFASVATDQSILGPAPLLIENITEVDLSGFSISAGSCVKTGVIYDYGEETNGLFTQEGSEDTVNSTPDIYVARAEFELP